MYFFIARNSGRVRMQSETVESDRKQANGPSPAYTSERLVCLDICIPVVCKTLALVPWRWRWSWASSTARNSTPKMPSDDKNYEEAGRPILASGSVETFVLVSFLTCRLSNVGQVELGEIGDRSRFWGFLRSRRFSRELWLPVGVKAALEATEPGEGPQRQKNIFSKCGSWIPWKLNCSCCNTTQISLLGIPTFEQRYDPSTPSDFIYLFILHILHIFQVDRDPWNRHLAKQGQLLRRAASAQFLINWNPCAMGFYP